MQGQVPRPQALGPGDVPARVALLRSRLGVRDPTAGVGGQRLAGALHTRGLRPIVLRNLHMNGRTTRKIYML